MNKTEMLVIGLNDFLSTTKEWNVVTATGAEDAIEKFQQRDFDVVVFANAVDDAKLRKLFTFQQPEIILLQNNNDGLVVSQVKEALDKKQKQSKPSFSFVDDALQAAMLPITIQ